MAEEINGRLKLASLGDVDLAQMSRGAGLYSIEQHIAELPVTTTLLALQVHYLGYISTPENDRRFIEPLCRCIANLRLYNPTHTLRKLTLSGGVHDVTPFLVAAKQFGIRHLSIANMARLPVQSLMDFCRDNTHLKVLEMSSLALVDEDPTISERPQYGLRDPSVIPALDKLKMQGVIFENSGVAMKFLNIIALLNYTTLFLGEIKIATSDDIANEQEKQSVLSKLIKPSVQKIILQSCCRIDAMNAIDASTSVTQIQLGYHSWSSNGFNQFAIQLKLQEIATRNRALARFVDSPRGYCPSGDELLKLMRQFDNCPTGRYMLARCLSQIPSVFKIKRTDSSATGSKKQKIGY